MRRRLGNTHAGEVRSHHPASTRTAVGTTTSTVRMKSLANDACFNRRVC